jgi:hypothetical protein
MEIDPELEAYNQD